MKYRIYIKQMPTPANQLPGTPWFQVSFLGGDEETQEFVDRFRLNPRLIQEGVFKEEVVGSFETRISDWVKKEENEGKWIQEAEIREIEVA